MSYPTLTALLRARAEQQPTHLAYTFLLDGEDEKAQLTYAELDQRARAIGAWLQQKSTIGERALLLYPPGLDYIAAFFGCLYAGVIAVPAYPPRLNRPDERLQAIAKDAQATLALTTTTILSNIAQRFEQMPELAPLNWLATDHSLSTQAEDWRAIDTERSTLAFLQYTSGSTSAPRGVKVSHGNLLSNLGAIQECFETVPESHGVFWLPLYHDMGLIGGILEPLYCGGRSTLLSPTDFLQRPVRWLQAISRSRGTISGAPNFAYDLCVDKITPEQRAELDLSTWELAFNGAEPIRAETLNRFAETFAECGFRREAFYPCYGMAEATLIVAGGRKSAPPIMTVFDATTLKQNQARPVSGLQPNTTVRQLVGCGNSPTQHSLVIVHPESLTRCHSGQVGEIWVTGPSIAQGYWNRPDATHDTFGWRLPDDGNSPYLRTGDLGFLHQNELYVTGRIKDLIIIRGRNHYPQDIEQTAAESHTALAPSGGAAFSISIDGVEQLVIVHEIDRRFRNANLQEVAQVIRQAIAQQHELQVYAVVFLKPGHLLRTSSGKVQRRACRAAFLDGTLDALESSVVNNPVEIAGLPVSLPSLTRSALLAAEPDTRLALLADYLQSEVARVLKVLPAIIDRQGAVTSLGLDSLMAVELQNTLETQLGAKIPMASLLEGLSIEQLAAEILVQCTREAAAPLALPIQAPALPTESPLSYGQRALWFLYQIAPESAAYNLPNAVRIRSRLNLDALRRAFQQIIDRHASLRTTFRLGADGIPVQHIAEQGEPCFQVEAAQGWPDEALNKRLVEEAHRPFDLETGPLLRIYVFTRAEDEHVLLLNMHHIISDLWSLAVLLQEVGQCYQAESAGNPLHLPVVDWHYTDYVGWEAGALAGPENERLWAYWKEALAGDLPALNLPADRARPPVQTDRGDCCSFSISPALGQAIKAFAQSHGVTLYTLLLAALEILLYRYTGQDDFAIGSPTTGRNRAEWARVVGYFVNPIVLRAHLAADATFAEFLSRVRQGVLAAFKHQDYPFALLIERLQPVRDPSRSPLFQVMFALQKAPLLNDAGLDAFALGDPQARLELGGLVLEAVPLEQHIAQFDLTLTMGETAKGLAGTWEYNSDLFDAATIARLSEHFTLLLEGLITNPQRRISNFTFLAADEQARLLAWNNTRIDLSGIPNLNELLEKQANQSPDVVAVMATQETVAGTTWQSLTYRELHQRANRLAHHLKKLGVGPEVCVGILLERSIELVVGILGILKAGGAYVPIDPEYPQERLEFILNSTGGSRGVLVTQQRLLPGLHLDGWQVVCLDDGEILSNYESGRPPDNTTQPENLACVIYTSGSSGQPKGVLIEHSNLINLVHSFITSYHPGTSDRILPLTSVASASFVGEVLPILCAGGALVLPTKADFLDFQKLVSVIADQEISILSTVPSLLAGLNTIADSLPKLRLILSGGETLLANDVEHLLEKATIINGYGLTETTVCSTYYPLNTSNLQSDAPLPVGRPVINHQIYVLDQNLGLMPVGCPGEIYIAGGGVARGYLNQPGLTAERFIPNPYTPGERLYRSGDRARWLPNGVIEYLGRIDRQVKIRGFRIELEEIEARLAHHPAVSEVAVIVREENGRLATEDKRLVAYVVLRKSLTATEDELRFWLAAQVPDYMLPAAFVLLSALPLLPNGKVDEKALPAPSSLQSQRSTAYVAPLGETERLIATVWQEVLNVERVGVHDNFFDLGGHSLLLVKAHNQLRSTLSQPIALIDLFKYPTVRALAKYLSQGAEKQLDIEQLQSVAEKQKAARQQRQQRLQAGGALHTKGKG